MSDDELREEVRRGGVLPDQRVRRTDSPLRLPAAAWATLAMPHPPHPPPPAPVTDEVRPVSPDLLLAPAEVLDGVRFVVAEHGQSFGPFSGRALREGFEGGRYRAATIAPVGTEDWVLARRLFDRTLSDGVRTSLSKDLAGVQRVLCPACLESILPGQDICPECDEPSASSAPPSTRGSIPEEAEGASWWTIHWRPIVTFGSILGLIMSGITLRYLAPGRAYSEAVAPAPTALPKPPTCEPVCWSGESCQEGICQWTGPASGGHLGSNPTISGPFQLSADMNDAMPLDESRFIVGELGGTEVHSSRTGQALGIVSEAAPTRRLVRAGDAIYAVGNQHISVLDPKTMRVRKTLELGALISDVSVGGSGRRALVALSGAHVVAVLSTELHVELDRIRFGDDAIGPIGMDDSGRRALTTTGQIPILGLDAPAEGAVYAFDPGRLATEQDRVRASLYGNPVSVLMSPDGARSLVALRQANQLVPLTWQASGAVRQGEPIKTCDQPEQVELVRLGRRAAVRCNRGRAVEILSLEDARVLRHLPFGAPVSDMVVSPDGKQLLVALPGQTDGNLGVVDLESYAVSLIQLSAPPTRLRPSESGDSVLVLSDRNKLAWIIR